MLLFSSVTVILAEFVNVKEMIQVGLYILQVYPLKPDVILVMGFVFNC